MAFILDSLKEKFGSEDEEEEGFSDLNYVIGNSSAMDVGEVPTPLDQRIGYAAQIGGKVMELQITTPSTFTIEREEMISTIDQLGIDVTLHSDMNAGYASAQKSGREGYGYDTVQDYFTEYLQELAAFKKEVERRGDNGPLFNIGRINPHISTTPLPPLSERMETDVGVDPFGYTINEYDENARKQRNHRKQNIYKNPEFLKNLYHTLILEMSSYPFQNYSVFTLYSEEFDEAWTESRHRAADRVFKDEERDLEDKVGAVLVARGSDQGIGTSWRKVLSNSNWDIPVFKASKDSNDDYDELKQVRTLGLEEFLKRLDTRPRLNFLDDAIFEVRQLTEEDIPEKLVLNLGDSGLQGSRDQIVSDLEEEVDPGSVVQGILEEVESLMAELWTGKEDEERYMSQEAKWVGLQKHLGIQEIRLDEDAYEIGKKEFDIEEMAAKVFSGANEYELFDTDYRENMDTEDEMHYELLQRFLQSQQFQREMWKESTIFYQVIPAWMEASNKAENDDHKGWEAPRFIWETIVEKWNEKDGVEIDLRNPRNGVEGEDRYMDLLENNKEFRMDVAAATGACYVWGHFTQRKSQFNIKDRDLGLNEREVNQVESDGWTWIDWMNRFGIGVNLETMHGSPQQKLKVWRPKDISVAAHAVNMTARKKAEQEGLGGLDHVNEELDGCPAKFTIDMEHVASLGATPWDEMKIFFDQEEELADEWPELGIDPQKPAAKILRQYHLMDPGVEGQGGTHHGAFKRGNKRIYRWLYNMVKEGFARNDKEPATILFELAEHKGESSYMMRLSMDLIELGVTPEELDPSNVSPGDEPKSKEEALIARFFGMDRSSYDREWAKIEEHAFDPLEGLLETEGFDHTSTGSGAIDQAGNRPNEWKSEEYR